MSGGVGENGQLTRSSNGLSPETNTKFERIFFVSVALTLVPLGTKLSDLLAQFLIGSPGTLSVHLRGDSILWSREDVTGALRACIKLKRHVHV